MKNLRTRIEVDLVRVTFPGRMPVVCSPAQAAFSDGVVPLSIEPSRLWVAVECIDENQAITGLGAHFDWNGFHWIGLGRTFKDQEEIIAHMEGMLDVQS